MLPEYDTMLELFDEEEQQDCGYCKKVNGHIFDGMWAECMTVDVFQDLIDRGWKRCGKYCYKPRMTETCCPQYTIKCSAVNFHLSKSQKKVLKKFNRFLAGEYRKDFNDLRIIGQSIVLNNEPDGGTETCKEETEEIDLSPLCITTSTNLLDDSFSNDEFIILSKPIKAQNSGHLSHKKKEKKKSNKVNVGKTLDIPKNVCDLNKQKKKEKKKEKNSNKVNVEKTLEQFIDTPKNVANEFTIKLISTSNSEVEWEDIRDTEFKLYHKYQSVVHGEHDEENNLKTFEDYLVITPLPSESFPNKIGPGYGSFHQQYWMNGKLIAVGVIDILPKCILSVYFFYDPDYRYLSLGTYGALREIHLTRCLNMMVPQICEYYMGCYIHTCPKMLYKGQYSPSYLLCPESYKWISLDKCLAILKGIKYSRLNENVNDTDSDSCTEDDLDNIKIFLTDEVELMLLKDYKEVFEGDDIEKFGSLLGKRACRNVIILD